MFDGAKKKAIEQNILKASRELIYIYKSSIKANISRLESAATEEESNSIMMEINRTYYDAVNNSILENMPGNTQARVALCMNPVFSPVKDYYRENGIYMGGVFAAILWWAIENKELDPKTISRINHLQMDIVQQALVDVSNEIG